MRVAVVGSRGWTDLERVRRLIRSLPRGTTVVSGGARGVDQAAEDEARKRGLDVRVFYPRAEHPPHVAPLLRNQEIIDAASTVHAFLGPCRKCPSRRCCPRNGWSHGTVDALSRAVRGGRRVFLSRSDGREWEFEPGRGARPR